MVKIEITLSIVLTVSLLLFAEVNHAGAANQLAYENKSSGASGPSSTMKVERGVNNILFGWLDIPRSIIEVTRDTKNPLWGLAAGAFKGTGKAILRTVSGISDIMIFPAKSCDELPVKPDELNKQIR